MTDAANFDDLGPDVPLDGNANYATLILVGLEGMGDPWDQPQRLIGFSLDDQGHPMPEIIRFLRGTHMETTDQAFTEIEFELAEHDMDLGLDRPVTMLAFITEANAGVRAVDPDVSVHNPPPGLTPVGEAPEDEHVRACYLIVAGGGYQQAIFLKRRQAVVQFNEHDWIHGHVATLPPEAQQTLQRVLVAMNRHREED